jgi:hypothetical protein
MNFLEICQEANSLVGMQGTVSSTTVTSGYQEVLIKFCKQAYIDIQTMRKDWRWMRSSTTFNTVAGTTEYSLATIHGGTHDIARWVPNMILYTDSNSYDTPLKRIPYDKYIKDDYPQASRATPALYATDPIDYHLYLNPPDDAYTITCHYYTMPVELSASADTPVMPEEHHMAIAYLGAAHFAAFMGNSNLYMILNTKADAMLGNLMRAHLPAKRVRLHGGAA